VKRYILRVIDRILIADDEPLARERVRELVRQLAPSAAIKEVGDGDAAVDAIRQWAPQGVFLDIQMPGRDGFAVLKAIGPSGMPATVFVTAYDTHALEAFDAAAVDYLLKPFDDARFATSWQRLLRAHAHASIAAEAKRLGALLAAVSGEGAPMESPRESFAERVLVRDGERTYPLALKDVRWMQSEGNYVDLFSSAGKHTLRETLTNLESRLDPARFVRVHRRVIVAIDQIKELQPWFAGDQVLILKDGTKLRVSRTRREAVQARLEGRA
jgi:two-component system LytT family response regulator